MIIAMIAIIIALILILILSIYLQDYDFDSLGIVLAVISVTCLLFIVTSFPIQYCATKSDIQSYYALKTTIKNAREQNNSEIERAALTQKIIDANQSLAGYRYWNKTIFDLFIPDEITKLEYLK